MARFSSNLRILPSNFAAHSFSGFVNCRVPLGADRASTLSAPKALLAASVIAALNCNFGRTLSTGQREAIDLRVCNAAEEVRDMAQDSQVVERRCATRTNRDISLKSERKPEVAHYCIRQNYASAVVLAFLGFPAEPRAGPSKRSSISSLCFRFSAVCPRLS